MENHRYFPGTVPVIISIPHAGTVLPDGFAERLVDAAKPLPDTDWHVDRLYAFAREKGVHVIAANYSRYVIDLNRGSDNASLYEGRFTTGLCPLTRFDASPLYIDGTAPDAAEIQERIATYWQPYHTRLQGTIDTLHAQHGRVLLLDAHSIASHVPTLFEGRLPDLNFGTGDSISADAKLADDLLAIGTASDYSAVLNGRFKGGYITRHYGNPAQNIHAVQLELAQCNYMDEVAPYSYSKARAEKLQIVLERVIDHLIAFAV